LGKIRPVFPDRGKEKVFAVQGLDLPGDFYTLVAFLIPA
jgi:hypothetical protein